MKVKKAPSEWGEGPAGTCPDESADLVSTRLLCVLGYLFSVTFSGGIPDLAFRGYCT